MEKPGPHPQKVFFPGKAIFQTVRLRIFLESYRKHKYVFFLKLRGPLSRSVRWKVIRPHQHFENCASI